MTFYIILGLSTFIISLIGTRLTILTQRKRTLPTVAMLRDGRPSPTPGGGGIAVVITLVIGLLMADVDYSIVIALFLLAAVSLIDDVIGVPAPVKLLVQIVTVALSLAMLPAPLWGGMLPEWLDKGIAAVLWIALINLFAAIDGTDGLAAAETMCAGAGLCLIAVVLGTFPTPLAAYGLVAATAACGFLWWNRPPARILLGEVGSMPLGFLLGYLLLLAAMSGYGFAAAILPAYYIGDGAVSALAGWRCKAAPERYHRKAMRLGRKPAAVVWYICGVNVVLIVLAVMSVLQPDNAVYHLALAYMAVFMLLGFFAHPPTHPHHETT